MGIDFCAGERRSSGHPVCILVLRFPLVIDRLRRDFARQNFAAQCHCMTLQQIFKNTLFTSRQSLWRLWRQEWTCRFFTLVIWWCAAKKASDAVAGGHCHLVFASCLREAGLGGSGTETCLKWDRHTNRAFSLCTSSSQPSGKENVIGKSSHRLFQVRFWFAFVCMGAALQNAGDLVPLGDITWGNLRVKRAKGMRFMQAPTC